MRIREACQNAHKTAVEKGFWDEPRRSIPESLALIHSEVSEALEAYRIRDEAGFYEELADICIRVFDLAQSEGVNLEFFVAKKLSENKERPVMHGGKRL